MADGRTYYSNQDRPLPQFWGGLGSPPRPNSGEQRKTDQSPGNGITRLEGEAPIVLRTKEKSKE